MDCLSTMFQNILVDQLDNFCYINHVETKANSSMVAFKTYGVVELNNIMTIWPTNKNALVISVERGPVYRPTPV